MKSKIISFGSYGWLFLPDFPQTDCLLKLYMLFKSARTVSHKLHWGKRVYIGLTSWLTEDVVIILCFCAKLVFILFIIGLS